MTRPPPTSPFFPSPPLFRSLATAAGGGGHPAVDDGRNAEDEAEHHYHREAVADASLEVGGVEPAARLRERGQCVEEKHRRDHEHGAQPRAKLRSEFFSELHRLMFVVFSMATGFSAESCAIT